MEENRKIWEEILPIGLASFNLRGGVGNWVKNGNIMFLNKPCERVLKWWLKWVLIRLMNYMNDEQQVRLGNFFWYVKMFK